jgi:uncharacterized protein YgiM (DUF1202 family)
VILGVGSGVDMNRIKEEDMKKAIIPLVFLCSLLFITDIVIASKVYVTGGKVNIRSGPGTSFEIITSVRNNAALEKLDIKGNWTKIKMENGQEGWIFNKLISATPIDPLKVSSDAVKKLLIEVNKATGSEYLTSVVVKEKGMLLEVTVSELWDELSDEQKERLVQMMAGGFAVNGCVTGLRKNCDGTDYPITSFIAEDGKKVARKDAIDVEIFEEEEEGEGEEEEEEEEE